MMRGGKRSNRGAAIILITVICVAALSSSLLAGAALVRFLSLKQRSALAAEAAALACANTLSTLVIEDPDYGYIALSDYAPSSGYLTGGDGKPLPVLSINTITATARANMLVASRLGNPEMLRLATLDAARARNAARRLSYALQQSLSSGALSKDRFGKPVKPLDTARAAFGANLSEGSVSISDFKAEAGTLDSSSGHACITLAPGGGFYPAFADQQVMGSSYVFAATARQSTLAALSAWRPYTGDLASVVRVTATVKDNQTGIATGFGLDTINSAAAAVPFALEDRQSAGTLVLGLPQGLPGGYFTLLDFLHDHRLSRARTQVFRSTRGDYPQDQQALLLDESGEHTLASVFALGLYDWLRTTHGRLRVDQVLTVLGSRIQPSEGSFKPGESLVYRFKGDALHVESYRVADMTRQVVHENQLYTMAFNTLPASNGLWNVSFRDQVRTLGQVAGGKHAGQLMECDGSYRPIGSLHGQATVSERGESERRSYFEGGLAVEYVISSENNIVAASGL